MSGGPAPVRIALLWHSSNAGNLGLGALTLANVDLLRRAAGRAGRELELVVIGPVFDRPGYPQIASLPAFSITGKRLVSPRGYAGVVRNCDLVVDIGSGDSFADIYGRKRLAYLMATKAIAIGMGKPLVLAPQTIGPFRSRVTAAAATGLIACTRATFIRDEMSLRAVAAARARAKVEVTTDVAFALPFMAQDRVEGGVRVAFNISALLYHGGYSGRNQFGLRLDYPEFVRRAIAELAGRPEVELRLVPHVISRFEVENDLTLCRRLAAASGLEEPPDFADPVMAKSFISGCDFLIGSRMHACIAAVSAGVATVPIGYSRKFAGLFEAIGYRHTVDARTVDTDSALAAVVSAYEARESVARDAAAASEIAREKLDGYVDALVELIGTA